MTGGKECIKDVSPVNGHGQDSSESQTPPCGASEQCGNDSKTSVTKASVTKVSETDVESGVNSTNDRQGVDSSDHEESDPDQNADDQQAKSDQDMEDADLTDQEEDPVEKDDNFASIVSFFLCFGPTLGITYSISDLKGMIEDKKHVHNELIELHIKLLRKRRKYINKEKWEKSLVKFIHEYSPYDAWEMERFGYRLVKSSIKIQLLKNLLEAQFDYNLKFKSEINAVDATNLRLRPLGRDVKG